MTCVEIYRHNGWSLLSYGLGLAYELRHGAETAWLQGDDALAFEASTMRGGFLVRGCERVFAEYLG